MQNQSTELAGNGICVAHGYGLKIHVHRGHLIVHDGVGRQRQTRRYHRATSKLRRLVLIGHTGYLTLEALRWLYDVGAALIHIDSDGRLTAASTVTGPGHATLRRAQALASASSAGIEVARGLLRDKLAGQASLLGELPGGSGAQAVLDLSLGRIENASSLPALISAEAEAASAYWNAWSELPVTIGQHGRAAVPDHWLTFGQRHSPLTNGPRTACNPPNAILNYLYALLEAEATLACHAVGLDPLLGIFHTDQRHRSSLTLDAMEAVRPLVDAYVLALIAQRTLAREDFAETRKGACRLGPGIAMRLAATTDTWRHHIAPVAERMAHLLATDAPRPTTVSAPLTRAYHRAAWDKRAPNRKRRQSRSATPALPNACHTCGAHLSDRRKRYCEHCRRQRWAQQAERGRANAASVLARLRSEQRDPAHGGHAAETRGRKNAAHQRAVRDWDGLCADPAVYRTEILPALSGIATNDLVAATGLSGHYCSLIRLGKRVPHARHWEALRRLGS